MERVIFDKTAGNWRSPVECVNGMSNLDKY